MSVICEEKVTSLPNNSNPNHPKRCNSRKNQIYEPESCDRMKRCIMSTSDSSHYCLSVCSIHNSTFFFSRFLQLLCCASETIISHIFPEVIVLFRSSIIPSVSPLTMLLRLRCIGPRGTEMVFNND